MGGRVSSVLLCSKYFQFLVCAVRKLLGPHDFIYSTSPLKPNNIACVLYLLAGHNSTRQEHA